MVTHLFHGQNRGEADVTVGKKLDPFVPGLGEHDGADISLHILLQSGIPLRFDVFGPVDFLAEFSPEFILHRSETDMFAILGFIDVVASITAG